MVLSSRRTIHFPSSGQNTGADVSRRANHIGIMDLGGNREDHQVFRIGRVWLNGAYKFDTQALFITGTNDTVQLRKHGK